MAKSIILPAPGASSNVRTTAARIRRLRLGLLWRFLLASLAIGFLPLALLSYTAFTGYETASVQATNATSDVLDAKSLQAQQLRTQQTATEIARFLEDRVQDTRAAAVLPRTAAAYLAFYQAHQSLLWYLGGTDQAPREVRKLQPIYREVAFIGPQGQEEIRIRDGQVVPAAQLGDVSNPANTTYRTETYFSDTRTLPPGAVYASHVTGWYVPKAAQLGSAADPRHAVDGAKYAPVVRLAMPVFDAAGQFAGLVLLTLDYRHVMEFAFHIVSSDEEWSVYPDYAAGNYAYMFDDAGWEISHPRYWVLRGLAPDGRLVPHATGTMTPTQLANHPFQLQFGAWADPNLPRIYNAVLGKQSGFVVTVNQAGARKATTYAPIPFAYGVYSATGIFGGLAIGANMAEFHKAAFTVRDKIQAKREDLQVTTLLITGASALFLIVVTAFVTRGIIRPVSRLTDAARSMERGELAMATLDRLLQRRIEDEVTKLTQVFKHMAEQVQLRERRLKEQIVELHIQIDEQKKQRELTAITDTDFFRDLQARSVTMRARFRQAEAPPAPAAPGEPAAEEPQP